MNSFEPRRVVGSLAFAALVATTMGVGGQSPATAPGYQLEAWECDPESSRAPIKMMVPKYK